MRVGIAAATHRTSIGLASARFWGAADYGHVSRCSLRDFRSEGVIAITAADPVKKHALRQADYLSQRMVFTWSGSFYWGREVKMQTDCLNIYMARLVFWGPRTTPAQTPFHAFSRPFGRCISADLRASRANYRYWAAGLSSPKTLRVFV